MNYYLWIIIGCIYLHHIVCGIYNSVYYLEIYLVHIYLKLWLRECLRLKGSNKLC